MAIEEIVWAVPNSVDVELTAWLPNRGWTQFPICGIHELGEHDSISVSRFASR